MSLDGYTYEQLVDFLDSDDPLPAPLTRRQVREAVKHADVETGRRMQEEQNAVFARVMRLREQQKEADFQTFVMKMTSELEGAHRTIRQQQASIIALRWALSRRMHVAAAWRALLPSACAVSQLKNPRVCDPL